MRRWIGRWVIAVGVLHTILGLVFLAPQVGELAAIGLWNALGDGDPMRSFAFWFFFAGIYAMLAGALADWIERATGGPLPRVFGWTLLVSTIVGAVLMPISGFLLLVPPAVAALRRTGAGDPARLTMGQASADERAALD